jgi:hypothetical protein
MITDSDIYNFVLADKDMKILERYGGDKLIKIKNGISSDLFSFEPKPEKGDRTLYLGKIDARKSQYKYQMIDEIDFVGPLHCSKFNSQKNYCGLWSRNAVHKNLTKYGNMLLLSMGEADPLVIKEALIAGLGIVVNYTSGQNLDEKPFITLIRNESVNDIGYIRDKLNENRVVSLAMRDEIRAYGRNKFDISVVCKNYLKTITD